MLRKSSPNPERLAICIDNSGYEVSLEQRKIYIVLPDPKAAKLGLVRIVDESGESYLYPKRRFIAAQLPSAIKRAVIQAA